MIYIRVSLALRFSVIPRESGDPVTRGSREKRRLRGILDRPPSRTMTGAFDDRVIYCPNLLTPLHDHSRRRPPDIGHPTTRHLLARQPCGLSAAPRPDRAAARL